MTSTLWFAVKLYGLPETTLNGDETAALPDNVPPPVFWTVKARSAVVATGIDPKSWLAGVTEIAGASPVTLTNTPPG